MRQFFLPRLTLFSSMALLMLVSCTNQFTGRASVQPTVAIGTQPDKSESTNLAAVATQANQVQTTPVAEVRTIAIATTNPLSTDQKAQLTQLGIEVVLPTYLPSGFQLTQLKTHRKSTSDIADYSYYTVSYKGPNNTCIEAGNGYQNTALSTSRERLLSTSVGTFKVQSGTYRLTSITRHWAALLKEDQQEGGQVILTGGKLAGEQSNCNPIDQQEFDKVLQSAEVIAQKTTTEQSSAPSTGNLLSPAQVEKLTQLPIPIVAPTYLPEGFQVVRADGESAKYINGDDDSGYIIEYQGADGTCFTIYSAQDGPYRLKQVGQVESALGPLKIYESTYEGRSSILSFIPVRGNPVMISPVSKLNPATNNYEECPALDRAEYERILKSIDLVK